MNKSAEHIYALLVDANPIPDFEGLSEELHETPHLRIVDPRRDTMQTETRTMQPITPPPPRGRNWIPALVGVAAVVIAIVLGALALRGDDSELVPPADEPTGTTAVELARQTIADWNTGDSDAFFGRFASEAQIEEVAVTDSGLRAQVAFYMALQQQAVVGECVTGPDTVTCTTVTTDALSGPVGAESAFEWTFRVEDGAIVSLDWSWRFDAPSVTGVIRDMSNWIETDRPDVWATAFAADCASSEQYNCNSNKWLSSAAAGAEMLRLAPDYFGQPSVELARQAIDDWNAGDADAFFGRFAPDARLTTKPASDPYLRDELEYHMAIDNQAEVQRCLPLTNTVTCIADTTDAVSRPLGVEIELAWKFEIEDGAIAAMDWYWDLNALHPQDVAADMADWIEQNYPDVWVTTFASDCSSTEYNCWRERWSASAEAGAELLRLAPEFRAQAEY
jgi:hypothetical protein